MAHNIGVSIRETAAGFDTGKICRLAIPLLNGPGRAFEQWRLHFFLAQAYSASRSHARRDLMKQGEDQLLQSRPHLLLCQFCSKQSDPAVDVISDGARRKDTIPDIGGYDSSDGQAVSLVDVWHGEGGLDDSRQEGAVRHLLQGEVLHDRFHQTLIGIDDPWNPHPRFVVLREQPSIVIEFLNSPTHIQPMRRGTYSKS